MQKSLINCKAILLHPLYLVFNTAERSRCRRLLQPQVSFLRTEGWAEEAAGIAGIYSFWGPNLQFTI